eukprot:5113824-Pyramimonas_sp.AAC.1
MGKCGTTFYLYVFMCVSWVPFSSGPPRFGPTRRPFPGRPAPASRAFPSRPPRGAERHAIIRSQGVACHGARRADAPGRSS